MLSHARVSDRLKRPISYLQEFLLRKNCAGVADSRYESTFRLMLQNSPYLASSNWEILNSYLYSAMSRFTLSELTRIGPTTQLPIPLLNAFGIAFLRMFYEALISELIN